MDPNVLDLDELERRAERAAGNNATICMEIGRDEFNALLAAAREAERLRKVLVQCRECHNEEPGRCQDCVDAIDAALSQGATDA